MEKARACFISYAKAESVMLRLTQNHPDITRWTVMPQVHRGEMQGYNVRYHAKSGVVGYVSEDML